MVSDFQISNECNFVYGKVLNLINERLDKYKRLPLIHEFDDGNVLFQYFNNWESHIDEVRERKFVRIGNIKNDKTAYILYYPNDTTIKIKDNKINREYLVLNGKIEFSIDQKKVELNSYNRIDIKPEESNFSFTTLDNTYLILIK